MVMQILFLSANPMGKSHLEDEFLLLWEMRLVPAPRSPSHRHRSRVCRSPGCPASFHPKAAPIPLLLFYSWLFLTLKKQNSSRAVSSRDESPQPRSQRRENK